MLSDKKGGRRLYGLALLANVVNNLGMGPPLYAFAAKHLCVQPAPATSTEHSLIEELRKSRRSVYRRLSKCHLH